MAKYCYYQFLSQGAILVLVMSGLLYAVHWFLYAAIALSLPDTLKTVVEYVHVAFWVLLPVIGWVAESWLGRYRAIVVGLVLSLVTILTIQAAFVMLQFDWSPFPILVLLVISMSIGTFGIGSFYTIMLPFALDQMIGASAEQLSAVVQWYSWGIAVGGLFEDIIVCVPIPNQLQPWEIRQTLLLATGTLCLSAVLIMDCLCHKWLDTNNKTGNPIKLIFQVLNYARKNKCPRLRSALTYFDEEHPSRLDFGKHKFGGPFTEEEVEDVKTIFRIIPLILLECAVVFFCELGISPILAKEAFKCVHLSSLKNLSININALSFVFIPVYRFIVYPLVRKHIPSLLKMMVAGLSLLLISTVINATVTATMHFSGSHNITLLNTPQESLYYWIVVITVLNGLGVGVTFMYLFEFIMAQTPNRMRGIMMGTTLFAIGLCTLGSHLLTGILNMSIPRRILFYFYLAQPPLAILILIVFIIAAKRYKLRERERHVNIQAIVEEHYERYFDQEEEEENMREAELIIEH